MSNLYLIPHGKNGYYYEPEIKEVIDKYSLLKADLSNPAIAEELVKEIGARIREIPLETVGIEEPPSRHAKYLDNSAVVFEDGSTLTTLHDAPDS